MAGTVHERELTLARAGRVKFDVANRVDDAEIRRLLRETPMPGQISISLEREPNYFADAEIPGEIKQTILARDGAQLICAGSCSIRDRYVNGQSRRVGYLGGLRLDGRHAGRFDILRRGYAFFRKLQADNPAEFYFTSIAADNTRARTFLERGLPGMPRYEPIGEFVTVIIATSGGRRARELSSGTGTSESGGETMDQGQASLCYGSALISFLNKCNQANQFAPCWSAEELIALQPLGLRASDYHIQRHGGQIVTCVSLWDQRCFKQTVIKDYTSWLALVRPVFNVREGIMSRPRLPAVGTALASAFVSHLGIRTVEKNKVVELIGNLRTPAYQRGIEHLTLGFAANDPRLAQVRSRFACREYRSQLYVVHWPGVGSKACDLDGRSLAPEVALL
jgi:hypothetical protein